MTANTAANYAGILKRVYADEIANNLPAYGVFQDLMPFKRGDKQVGEAFYQAVYLTNPQGFTYGDFDDGIMAYASAIPGQMKQAVVYPYQLALTENIGFKLMSEAAKDGPAAFGSAVKQILQGMDNSCVFRGELIRMYGGTYLGTVSGSPSSGVITIPTAEYSEGIWSANMEGAKLEFRDATTGALRATDAYFVSTDPSDAVAATPTITVTDTTLSGVVDTDLIYLAGSYGKQAAGISTILSKNATTDTLFGISCQYKAWRPQVLDVNAVLTTDHLFGAVAAKLSSVSYQGVADVYLNPNNWGKLNISQAALRQYTSPKETVGKNGFAELEFAAPFGTMRIKQHPMLKIGTGYVLTKGWSRIGSREIGLGGPNGGDVIRELEQQTGYQIKMWGNDAPYLDKPQNQILLKRLKLS